MDKKLIEDDEDDTYFNNDFSNENDEKESEIKIGQKNIVIKLLNVLDERERDVIESYYGINDKKELTLTDIGKKYNLSSERVRQIKKKGLMKLRTEMLLLNYSDYL